MSLVKFCTVKNIHLMKIASIAEEKISVNETIAEDAESRLSKLNTLRNLNI